MRLASLALTALALTALTAACDASLDADDATALPRATSATDVSTAGRAVAGLGSSSYAAGHRGELVFEPRVGEPPIDPMTWCADRVGDAHGAVAAARLEHAGCTRTSDCTLAFADTRCGGASVHAVSHLGKAAFEARVDDADDAFCADLPPECPIAVSDVWGVQSVCVEGTCQLEAGTWLCEETEDLALEVDTIEGCLDCDVAASKARGALATVAQDLGACERDEECVLVDDFTGCTAGCGYAVRADARATYAEARDDVEAAYCGGECPIAMPGCVPQRPACVAGRCAMVAEPSVEE